MQGKYLQSIIIILVGVGLYFSINVIYTSYQMHQTEESDLLVALIGVIITISWNFPFFIIAYWLYRKQKTNEK